MRRKRGKPEMPRPRRSFTEWLSEMERETGRWSVRMPHDGRIEDEGEGKRRRKAGLASHLSRRAPERQNALKWVKSEAEGKSSRQMSRNPKGSMSEAERAPDPMKRVLCGGGGP